MQLLGNLLPNACLVKFYLIIGEVHQEHLKQGKILHNLCNFVSVCR